MTDEQVIETLIKALSQIAAGFAPDPKSVANWALVKVGAKDAGAVDAK